MPPHPTRVLPFPAPRRVVAPRPQERSAALILLLVVVLVASWLAAVIPMEKAVTVVGADGKFVMEEVKTPLYYAVRALAIASGVAAGLLAALMGRFRAIGFTARLAFYILILTAALWAATAYAREEIFSSEIFGATGPFVWFTLLLVIAGADRYVWRPLDHVIRLLAYLSSALAVRTLVTSGYIYYKGFSKYTLYAGLLMWLGGWTLLTATRLRGWRLAARAVPVMVMALMAICAQSRSWTILSFLLAGVFIVLRSREQGSVLTGVRTVIMACLIGGGAAALAYVALPQTVTGSVNGLTRRIEQDTRTAQYTEFFSVVPVSDLILGRGPKGTWYWTGMGEYQFFDNGYLWMLFVGGVPILFSYLAIVIWPAVRALRCRPRANDAVAVWLVLLWALALTGLSTFTLPSVGIASQLVSLWAGRCHLLLAETDQVKFASAQSPMARLRCVARRGCLPRRGVRVTQE